MSIQTPERRTFNRRAFLGISRLRGESNEQLVAAQKDATIAPKESVTTPDAKIFGVDFAVIAKKIASEVKVDRRTVVTVGAAAVAGVFIDPDSFAGRVATGVSRLFEKTKEQSSLVFHGFEVPKINLPSLSLLKSINPQVLVNTAEVEKLPSSPIENFLKFLADPRKAEAASELAPKEAGMILGRKVWKTNLWWPIFESTALKRKLPRIHDTWWPAHGLDLLGIAGNIQRQAKDMADKIINGRSETAGYAGHCPWLAAAQLLEEEPQVYPGENFAGATDENKIRALKQGALVIAHSGDILVPIAKTKESLTAAVLTKLPVAVNHPANLGSGDWFRPLLGISQDGNLVRVTNFREPNENTNETGEENLPLTGITAAYLVFPADSEANIPSKIKESTSFWRYVVNRVDIRRKVFRQAA